MRQHFEPTAVQLSAYMIEQIEKALTDCRHPHVSTFSHQTIRSTRRADVMWCNLCGAIHTGAGWISPHCRDLLLKLVGHG